MTSIVLRTLPNGVRLLAVPVRPVQSVNQLLRGGMSASLVDTVREQLGLAYTADCTMAGGDVWASFVVHTVTTPDKLDALVGATGELLRAAGCGHRPGATGSGEEPVDRLAGAWGRTHLRHDGAGRRRALRQRAPWHRWLVRWR
jgi:hypothetical protein